MVTAVKEAVRKINRALPMIEFLRRAGREKTSPKR